MRAAYRVVITAGLVLFVSSVYIHIRPSLLSIVAAGLAALIILITLVVSLCLGVLRWRKSSRWWMMPALCCIAFLLSVPAGTPIGIRLADWQFKRHLAEYVAIVDGIRQSNSAQMPTFTIIDVARRPPNVRTIRAASCQDGSILVEFLTDTGAPLVHTGYLFKGYEHISCFAQPIQPEENWPYLREVIDHWYHFADAPGL